MERAAGAPDGSLVEALRGRLDRRVLCPGEAGYDSARTVWNAMIDRRPAAIVRCTDVDDIMAALDIAYTRGLPVSVRGGGHSVAGHAVADGGLMLDLSPMKAIYVDPAACTVRAEAGVLWGELDRATLSLGLATTGGLVSTTGIAGLTLGGGLGWLMRRFGLACDNLLSADVVTAAGRAITASAQENADLSWGLRGGGGNFGVVTSFTYRLHPLDRVLAGLVVYPYARARDVFAFHRDYAATAPDELVAHAALLTLPDLGPVAALLVCYSGSIEDGERALQPLRRFAPPVLDTIQPMPYTQLQRLYDEANAPGLHNYWKSSFLQDKLSDAAIETLVRGFGMVPSPRSNVLVEHVGGAVRRVAGGETAFAYRDAEFDFLISAVWNSPAQTAANVAWARELFAALRPSLRERAYVNYLDAEDAGRVQDAYGTATYARLVALKNKYDPTNIFRFNQNIRPG
jgi:FAD/FMN-containing dehydrogenase